MRPTYPILLVWLAPLMSAMAQTQPTRVEQGVGDVDPSRTSLRTLSRDLRSPTGFESVYRFDRVDAFGNVQRNFMRIDGATYAVFPRSQYIATSSGVAAAIPAGTTFYIGGPPKDWSARPAVRPAPSMISSAIDTRLPTRTALPPIVMPAPAPSPRGAPSAAPRPAPRVPLSIYENEEYRRQRLNELLSTPRSSSPPDKRP